MQNATEMARRLSPGCNHSAQAAEKRQKSPAQGQKAGRGDGEKQREKPQRTRLATTTNRPFSTWSEQVERVSRVSPYSALTPVSYSASAFTFST